MNLVNLPVAGLIPGGGEWIWIFVIVLLLFGGAKLPSLARGLGQSIKEFKKSSSTDEDDKTAAPADTTKKVEPAATTKTHGAN